MPRLRLPLAAFAAIVAVATPAAAWTAVEQVEPYRVSGQSGAELYASIGANGPEIAGGRRTIAHTTFRLTWRRDYRPQADGACVLVSAVPKLIITYTLPRPSGKLPAPVAASWKRFYDGLAAHERVHGRHIIEMVGKIEAVSTGLRAEADGDCQKVRASLQTRLKELSDEQRRRGRDFDLLEMREGGNVHDLILALVNGP